MRKSLSWKHLLAPICFLLFFITVSTAVKATIRYVNHDGICGGNSPCYTTIQAAINASSPGDIIMIAAGTYNENVNVDKWLTLNGAGNTTIIQPLVVGPGISLNSTGTNSGERAIIKNLMVTGAIGGGNTGTGISILTGLGYITIENVSSVTNGGHGIAINHTGSLTDIIVNNSDISNNGSSGFRVPTSLIGLNGLTLTNSHFDGNGTALLPASGAGIGLEINAAQVAHPIATTVDPARLVTNVLIQTTTFNNNLTKGIYAERLDNATLQDVTLSVNGVVGTVSPTGIDLNLKFNAFHNITLNNVKSLGNAPTAAGIYIKARNDGGTYGPRPAFLTDVNITGGEVTGSKYGIIFENNITDVEVHYMSIHDNSTAGMANAIDGQPVVNAECNWWGSPTGPNAVSNPSGTGNAALGNIDFTPWATTPTFTDTDNDGKPDGCDDDDDNDGDPNSTDCAPQNPNIHHGATELCNGIDDNCNGQTDEGFVDTDNDGMANCVDPDDDNDGDPDGTDCAPLNPAVHHGATEICNGIDDNCNGQTDEGFTDTDNDGMADCVDPDDDNDGVPDTNDCAPLDPTVSSPQTYYRDADGDGYGDATYPITVCSSTPPPGFVRNNYDCDDHKTANKPQDEKVLMCHNGKPECVPAKDTLKKQKDGWTMGPCTQSNCGPGMTLMCHDGQAECVKDKDTAKKANEGWTYGPCTSPCGPDETLMCRNGEEKCFKNKEVPKKQSEGWVIGHCPVPPPGSIRLANSEEGIIPQQYKVSNYPNPFSSTTTIRYELPFDSKVSIQVYNLMGKVVATVLEGDRKAGIFTVDFNADKLGKGMFYYKIIAQSKDKQFVQTNKMISVK